MQTDHTELAKAMRARKARRDDIIGSIAVTTYCALIGSLTVAVIVTAFKII